MSDTEKQIVAFLSETISASGTKTEIATDTGLLTSGLLDSIGLVGLIEFLEARFGIRISEADLASDMFETPASIARFVEERAN